jgi:hypothetical protein
MVKRKLLGNAKWYSKDKLEEKLEELAYRVHFRGRSQFGDLGFKNIQSQYEASNNTFWDRKFVSLTCDPSTLFYILKSFQ